MENKVHVVEVIKRLTHGGAEHLVVNLASSIDVNKFRVTVLVIEGLKEEHDEKMIEVLERNNVELVFFKKQKSKLQRFNVVSKIISFLRSAQPDVIHAHLEHCSIYVGLASFFYSKGKYYQTLHNTVLTNKPLLKLLKPRFSKTIAISKEVEEVAINELGLLQNHIEVIYNGVDTDYFSPQGEKSTLIEGYKQEGNINLLSIGRLTTQKGHEYLIKAIANYDKKNSVNLFIVGEGELRDNLKKLVENLGLEKNVYFLGGQSNVPEILRSCDIYVMPSLWEGLSVSLLEAISAGIPIIATDVGSNKSLLKESGVDYIIVEPKDCEGLKNAINSMSYNHRKLSNNNVEKEWLPVKYTAKEFTNRHQTLYLK